MPFMDSLKEYASTAMEYVRPAIKYVKDYTSSAMDYFRKNFDADSVKDFFKKRPETLAALALAAYWTFMPVSWHQAEGHDHKRYCKGWTKYVDLGIATVVPTLLDNAKEDWHNYIVDGAVDLAIPDTERGWKEKERIAGEYLKEESINNKIKKYTRLAVFYDILDWRIQDPVLLPKYKMSEKVPDQVSNVPTGVFKGKHVDIGSLILTGWAAAGLGGGMRAFHDKGRLESMAVFTAAELIYSPLPTVTLHVGDEVRRLARKYVDEVYEKAA